MDWIRILLTVVVIYLIFLVFTKFTKWIFKVVIVVLLLGVVIYGNLNYEDLVAGEDYLPLLEDDIAINPIIEEDLILEEEIDLELIEEDFNELNETIENEFLNETEEINITEVNVSPV